MTKSYKRGFTLIELLVVIAIIGILASIVLASLNSARQKGRDARRIADIKEIQLALELSYDATGSYPATISTSTLVTPGYISVIPADPANNAAYSYSAYYTTGASPAICSSYHLGASLETNNNPALNDAAHITSAPSGYSSPCTGSLGDFHASVGAACNSATDAGTACYDVKP
jgi:general secretion pathway protein G